MATQSTNNTIVATPTLTGSDLLVHGAAIGSKWPALFAVILGAVVLFGVGFRISVSRTTRLTTPAMPWSFHATKRTAVFPSHRVVRGDCRIDRRGVDHIGADVHHRAAHRASGSV